MQVKTPSRSFTSVGLTHVDAFWFILVRCLSLVLVLSAEHFLVASFTILSLADLSFRSL